MREEFVVTFLMPHRYQIRENRRTIDKKLSPIFHGLILSFVLRENYLDYYYNLVLIVSILLC